MRPPLILVLLACACSSPSEAESAPDYCPEGVLVGRAFLVSFTEHPGGTCGPASDRIILARSDPGPECTVFDSSISADGCQATTVVECQSDGITMSATTTFRIVNESMTRVEGTRSIAMENSDGDSCFSTYDFAGEQQ